MDSPEILHIKHYSITIMFLFRKLSKVKIFPIVAVHTKKVILGGTFTFQIPYTLLFFVQLGWFVQGNKLLWYATKGIGIRWVISLWSFRLTAIPKDGGIGLKIPTRPTGIWSNFLLEDHFYLLYLTIYICNIILKARLGEKNRFYYDEKLKRWVEEGAEPPPVEEAVLPPPPTTVAFQNGMEDYNMKDAQKTGVFHSYDGRETKSPFSSERSSGIPPIPPSSNQFSARGRVGVHSRYSLWETSLLGLSLHLFLCLCLHVSVLGHESFSPPSTWL
jgi:hypothetical protein